MAASADDKSSLELENQSDDINTVIAALLSESTTCRMPIFERLLNWTSTVYFHGLDKAELDRVVRLILKSFRDVAMVYLEDWQAVFDCFDMLLYRLKSAGHPYVDLCWSTLLSLAGRLALDKVNLNQPELSTRIFRPLYTTSSILINFHGPEGLMDHVKSLPNCNENPLLLELSLKFLIRTILFFPQYTFSAARTTDFFIQTSLEHPVSIIRRAALEGVRVLRIVNGGNPEKIINVIKSVFTTTDDREARAAFLISVDQPVAAKLDYSSQTIQMWLDVRDRGKGPDLPPDIAWVALAGDSFLPLCVRDGTFWEPVTGCDKAKIYTLKTHRLPMVEAGDAGHGMDPSARKSQCPKTAPLQMKPADQGAGDRSVRKKRSAVLPVAGSSTASMSKLTSNTSLSTYNVDEIPVIPALDPLPVSLTGWVEKEDADSARDDSATNRLSTGTVVLEKSRSEAKVVQKKSSRVKSKIKKNPVELEPTESAQDFYVGSSAEDQQTLPSSLVPNDEVPVHFIPVAKTRKTRKPKSEIPKSPTREPVSNNCPAQTIRLSRVPSQLNSTMESTETTSLISRPQSAISREAVPRIQPQAKLIRELPDTDDRPIMPPEDLPMIKNLPKPEQSSIVVNRRRKPLPKSPSPSAAPRMLKTARGHPSSEFDSGLGISSEHSPSSRPASRKYNRPYESARPELSRIEATNANSFRYIPPDMPSDIANFSVDQGSVSSRCVQTGRSGAYTLEAVLPPKGMRFSREQLVRQEELLSKPRHGGVGNAAENCFRIKPLAEARTSSTGSLFTKTVEMNATSKESGLESLNDDVCSSTQAVKPLRRFNRLVEPEGSEAASELALVKKTEEVRLDLQGLLDRMQKGPRYSNDILLAIEEFVQLSKAFPRVLESAIGAAFSQFLPLIYSLNSHVAAEAVAGLEIIMPLVERKLHLVAPQIVEALSNNMQNARTCEHSKKVFNQILDMQMDRAGTFLAPLSSHIATIMKKNKKEAFAFITVKYAETLGHAFPKPPKSQAAAVQILQFVKSVLVWITNYGDLDSSTKPEILAVDALIQQAIRSFGTEIVNKVCYDYRDTIKVFLTRKDGCAATMPKSGGVKLLRLVTRKSTLMAFKKKLK